MPRWTIPCDMEFPAEIDERVSKGFSEVAVVHISCAQTLSLPPMY